MRILVVSQYFWPEVFRVNEVVAGLVARGHRVTVLTGEPNYPQGQVFEEYRRAPKAYGQFEGAEVLRLPIRPRRNGNVNLLRNYWSFVWQGWLAGPWLLRGREFDAIFVFETSPITSALPAVLLRWLKKAPLAMWVLDLWPDTLSAVGMIRSPRALNAVGHLCRFIYRRCDLILVQSKSFFKPVKRWGGAPERTRYFPAWAEAVFDRAPEHLSVDPLVEQHRGAFTVMFAGNLGDAQDFPTVLAAAERLKGRDDIRWLVVGDGRVAPWVQEEIKRRELHNVVMLGRHPLDRMPAFFAGADALLVSLKKQPIFAMTIPGKVQSYLAAGKPLLGLLDGEGASVIREAQAGLVADAGDAQGLANCVTAMAELLPEQRARMAENGRRYAKAHFDRETLLDQLAEWLDLSARRRSRRPATGQREAS